MHRLKHFLIDMKKYSIYKLALALLPLLGLFACAENEGLEEAIEGEAPESIALTLHFPDYEVTEIGTRAGSDPQPLKALCFASDGTFLQTVAIPAANISQGSGGSFDVVVPLHKRTSSLELIYGDVTLAGNDMSAEFINNADKEISWGSARIADIIAKPASEHAIQMIRANAKVSVSGTGTGFKVNSFKVFKTSQYGSIAPKDKNTSSSTPNLKSGENFSSTSASIAVSNSVNIFETPADEAIDASKGLYKTGAKIVVKMTYGGTDYFYPIAFRKREGSGNAEDPGSYTYTPLNILRNHHYKVTVTEVRSAGYATEEMAAAAEPDNRVTVQITDVNPEVTDIVSSRDYSLGVCGDVEIECSDTSMQIVLVTSWPGYNNSRFTISDNVDWINTTNYTTISSTNVSMSTDRNSTGIKYVLKIPVASNTLAEDRIGTITIVSGELSRTIKVTQKARNYLLDDRRKVSMTMGSLTQSDYFNWIKTVKGAGESCFATDGVRRDNGLNFPAVPAYTVTYSIPKLSGDKNATVSGSIFKLSESSSAYTITMTSQSQPGIATGTFKVTNSEGVTITYPLYRSGYLHQMTSAMTSLQPSGKAVTAGWYYYEVVRVNGIWTLDRNLGASTGKPYISSAATLADNIGACGAYLKIATVKSTSVSNPSTILSSLGVSSFKIPTETELTMMNATTDNVLNTTYEKATVGCFNTQSPSLLSRVYIPHGGYYSDTEMKNAVHAHLWTSTLLSGSQGFSTESAEFGYWYVYFDIYTSKVNFSTMRIADGSGGVAPTSESVFKYMPLRLVWK